MTAAQATPAIGAGHLTDAQIAAALPGLARYEESCMEGGGVSREDGGKFVKFADVCALLAQVQPAETVSPAFYVRQESIDALANPSLAGTGAMLYKAPGAGMVPAYLSEPSNHSAELLAALRAIRPFIPSTSAKDGGAAKYSENVVAADMVRAAITKFDGAAA